MKQHQYVFFVIFLLLLTICLAACAFERQESADPEPTPTPCVSVAPAASTPPEETPAPLPTAVPEDEREVYIVSIEGTKYRSEPVTQEVNVLGTLSVGTELRCVEDRGEFMLVELPDGQQAWCNAWYLDAADEELAHERANAYLQQRMNRDSFVPMDGEPLYYCIASVLNCRTEPSTTSTILYQIVTGTKVNIYGRDNNFYLCRLPNGKTCYCSMDWLSDEATYVKYPGAVDLRVFLSGAEFDLLFASSNNITGKAMYPAIPLLEEKTAFMLLDAYQRFQEDGYTIKIYDAYRPRSAQIKLYDIVQDSRFIADPSYGGSWHQRGRAIDMSLIDLATGKELEMPTPMHTFSMDAARIYSSQWTEEARKNVDYMTEVMTEAGFGTIETEWWHFEYTGPGVYLDDEIDYSSLVSYPVSDYIPAY